MAFKPIVDAFLQSSLYRELIERKWIVPASWDSDAGAYTQPRIKPWTYPFEWSASMLRDAALHTLAIQDLALAHGYSLKDSSAYNITFSENRPIHVDLYSFVPDDTSFVWKGMDQFHREFLNPLLFEHFFSLPFQLFFRADVNGIPTETLYRLCSLRQRLSRAGFVPVTVKYLLDSRYAARAGQGNSHSLLAREGSQIQRKTIASLEKKVKSVARSQRSTSWAGYRQTRVYTKSEQERKLSLVQSFLTAHSGESLVDFGAHDGEYSRLALRYCSHVLALDADAVSIDSFYQAVKDSEDARKLTLAVMDLTNPSPGTGWELSERTSADGRLIKADAFLALAIVHHLRVAANIPTEFIVGYFASRFSSGLLEYVTLSDPMVQQLQRARPGIELSDYEEGPFIEQVRRHFSIKSTTAMTETRKLLWLEQ